MDFKAVIQGWLRDNNMFQGDLARLMDISPTSLSGILAYGNPKLTTLHKFQRAMNVSMTLFGEEGSGRKGGKKGEICTRSSGCCASPQVLPMPHPELTCPCACHE